MVMRIRLAAGCLAATIASLSASQPPKPMEAEWKNITVFTGVPSVQLLPIMNYMRTSLGVRCEYCHVAEERKYQLDDKPAKRRAREMILMTRAINDANFGGRTVVTCQTCHHGATIPASVPQIGSTFPNTTRRMPDEPLPAPLPSAADVFARYEAATRVSTLSSARVTLEGCHARVVDAGTPKASVVPRAACNNGESLSRFDDTRNRAVTTSPLPDGRSVRVGSDGRRAWTFGPDGLHWIDDGEFARFQHRLIPLLAARVRPADFASSRVTRLDVVDGVEVYTIAAAGTDGLAQELTFSKADGLLLRRTYYHPIAMGLDPEQFAFSDYRAFDGITLPTRIDTSYLDDQHLGVVKRLIDVKLGVPTIDRDFLPPDR
jgi:hypothetical protein